MKITKKTFILLILNIILLPLLGNEQLNTFLHISKLATIINYITNKTTYNKRIKVGNILFYQFGSVTAEEIKTEIFTNGPVDATFQVFEDFLTYQSGVYHHVEGKNVSLHTVKIIGWGEENGEKYWLVVNSWNEDWGEKGLFKIRLGTNECGIESQVEAGMPLIVC